jgi:long-subunit fatty acid transport protein
MNLSGSVWQEVNPIDTVVATYVRSQALKLEQSLQATSKNAFLVSLQFENRELDGDPGNLNSPILQTKDYLETWSFAWQYAYNDNLSLSTGYNYAKRDSKTALRDFNSNLLFINAKFQW